MQSDRFQIIKLKQHTIKLYLLSELFRLDLIQIFEAEKMVQTRDSTKSYQFLQEKPWFSRILAWHMLLIRVASLEELDGIHVMSRVCHT